jgi:farnesyl-diphosphate farnesyltransferase
LSIRVLPSDMREPVTIAYLLARAADTIADTPSITVERRLAHLSEFRAIVEAESDVYAATCLSSALTDLQSTSGERHLLASLLGVFDLLERLNESDAKAVRSVVNTLTSGMVFDLTTFGEPNSGSITSLETEDDLDKYCYLVAGCVGEFWTDISLAHTSSLLHWNAKDMRSLGVRFGLALQLTNILRDVPKDLRIGRCYLPSSELEKAGLRADDLRDAANARRLHSILSWGIRRTLDHFCAAEQYILSIPRRNLRLRLATLWPVLIGLGTLAELAASDDWLNPDTRIKIPRRSVYGIIALSLLCGRSNVLSRLLIRRIRRRVEQSIQPYL